MKCPKCGYTTFETSDSCRKCSHDLTEFKRSFNITPVVLPNAMLNNMASTIGSGPARTQQASAEPAGDMFSFDLPTETKSAAPAPAKSADPFSFDDIPAANKGASNPSPFSFDAPPASSTAHDPFADLLEQSPAGGSTAKPAAAPAAPKQDYELNSFSWDDSQDDADEKAAKPAAKKSDDDFNSLFDLGNNETK
jgi:hypothetical protein